jgi:hypothetical protein
MLSILFYKQSIIMSTIIMREDGMNEVHLLKNINTQHYPTLIKILYFPSTVKYRLNEYNHELHN